MLNCSKCVLPIYFFKNGIILIVDVQEYSQKTSLNVTLGNKDLYDRRHVLFYWGTYNISNDTINVLVYQHYDPTFPLPSEKTILTRYRGIIKDSSTIIDWHTIRPYPNGVPDFTQFKTTPRTLTFVPFKEKSLIDSDKAWVNKYRD